jgi:hypothetical protein
LGTKKTHICCELPHINVPGYFLKHRTQKSSCFPYAHSDPGREKGDAEKAEGAIGTHLSISTLSLSESVTDMLYVMKYIYVKSFLPIPYYT